MRIIASLAACLFTGIASAQLVTFGNASSVPMVQIELGCNGQDCHDDNNCAGTTRQCYQCCLDHCWDCSTQCQDACDAVARMAVLRSFPGLTLDDMRDPQMAFFVLRVDITERTFINADAANVLEWIYGASSSLAVQRYTLAVIGEAYWRADSIEAQAVLAGVLRDAMLFDDRDHRLSFSAWRIIEENNLFDTLMP